MTTCRENQNICKYLIKMCQLNEWKLIKHIHYWHWYIVFKIDKRWGELWDSVWTDRTVYYRSELDLVTERLINWAEMRRILSPWQDMANPHHHRLVTCNLSKPNPASWELSEGTDDGGGGGRLVLLVSRPGWLAWPVPRLLVVRTGWISWGEPLARWGPLTLPAAPDTECDGTLWAILTSE